MFNNTCFPCSIFSSAQPEKAESWGNRGIRIRGKTSCVGIEAWAKLPFCLHPTFINFRRLHFLL